MQGLLRKLGSAPSRFAADRHGQVAVTFALALLPVLLMTGAAIDYSRAVAQRSNLQQATDATVLAISHTELNGSSTVASLSTPAQTYLGGAMANASLSSLTLDASNTKLCIKATVNVPTTVMALANIKTVPVGAYACAAPPVSIEVALALDNSGSMADSAGGTSKIAALKTAAQKLVDTLNPSGTTSPNVAISVVPFSALVNVGTSRSASFLDTQGKSSIHWQNFHRPPPLPLPPLPLLTNFYPNTKFDLLNALTNGSWAGCVEERPTPYITTDTAPSASTPDTLFVPFLSPDDPGDTNVNDCIFINPVTQLVITSCAFGTRGPGLLDTHQFYNSYIYDTGAVNPTLACLLNPFSVTMDTIKLPLLPSDNQPNYYPLGGATMVCKYNGGTVVSTNTGPGLTTGPNYLCNTQQVTPLTTDRTVLSTAISAMQVGGTSNLTTGFMWAWRTISPVVAPFPIASPTTIGQQNPRPYKQASGATSKKYVVLMTDGANSWTTNPYSPWGSTYEAFGYYVNNRIASYGDCMNASYTLATTSASYRCQMDNVTLEACANAKAAGITVFTIGFSVPSDPIDAPGQSLLRSCASNNSDAFQVTDSASIATAFQQIATEIQSLRLTQ